VQIGRTHFYGNLQKLGRNWIRPGCNPSDLAPQPAAEPSVLCHDSAAFSSAGATSARRGTASGWDGFFGCDAPATRLPMKPMATTAAIIRIAAQIFPNRETFIKLYLSSSGGATLRLSPAIVIAPNRIPTNINLKPQILAQPCLGKQKSVNLKYGNT